MQITRRRACSLLLLAVSIAYACDSGTSGDDSSRRSGANTDAPTPAVSATRGGPPRYLFRDVTVEAGVVPGPASHTWGSLWADHDGNGYPDLFIGRHEGPPGFLRNDRGSFEALDFDFVDPPGYRSLDGDRRVDRHGCAWGEANGDGRPDLYCAVGANRGAGLGPNQLLLSEGETFTEVTRTLGIADKFGRSKSVNWLDYDSDGDLDVFVGNAKRMDGMAPNSLFERTEEGFGQAHVGLGDNLVTMSASWADWDVDGDPDLVVFQYPSSFQPAVAYENVRGEFRRTVTAGRTWPSWAFGNSWSSRTVEAAFSPRSGPLSERDR